MLPPPSTGIAVPAAAARLLLALSAMGAGHGIVEAEEAPARNESPARPASRPSQTDPPAPEAGVSFYPIPAVGSSKNEGVTYGLLTAFLFTNREGRVDTLITAEVDYQSLVGVIGGIDFHAYPSTTGHLNLAATQAARVANEYIVFFEDTRFLETTHFLADFRAVRLPTERFFGRGDDTPRDAESAHTANDYRLEARFGPRLSETVDVEGTFRWRHHRIGRSPIRDLPQTLDAYPDEPGISGGDVLAEGLRVVYDSRDTRMTPTRGGFATAFAEGARAFLPEGDVTFGVFGAEGTQLWPCGSDAQFVTVLHLQAQYVTGRDVPFWELSALGGSNTLRSENGNRFTHNGLVLANLEERIRVVRVDLFGVSGDVQVAPFVDVGKVFDSIQDLVGRGAARAYHASYGVGFRGVVPPSFVGRLDLAWGAGGNGVTITLDYPF